MESCTKSSFNPKINEKFKSTNQEGVFYLYNSNKFLIGTSLLLVELFFLNPHHVLAATNQDRTNVEREFIDNEDILHSNDNILIDEPANKQTSEDDESTSFYLNDLIFIVDGNVLKDSERLKIIKEHYINREVDLKTLRGCVYEVTNYYRTHGYPAATAYLPPQESEDNSIQICIELGQYGNIDINNQSHLSNRIVQGLINGLEKGKVIHTKKLESAIYNLQGLGGVKAYGIMRPGKNQGESDITIHLEKAKRNNYVLYSENYGSKNSGRYRYGFMADWYGLSSMGDHLSLNMLLSNKEQHNYGIRYEILAGHSGTKLGLGLGRTDYELGSHLSSLGATGLANTYSFFGSTPLWQTSNSSFGFNYGFDYQDMKDEMRSVEYLIKKHSHIFHLGINGFQRQKKTVTSFDLTYYTGILTGDESKISGIPLEIAPEGAYNKLLLNATVVQTFNSYWDLMFRFQGQKAGTNLDSSEKIYLGGANGVRAYPQGEGSGDEGYQTTAEVRYHTKVPGLTLSTYFDIGHVKYTHDTTISGGTTLKGWGVGVSWIRENDFFARIDYARRIGLAIDSTEDARSKQRIWFTIGKIW